MPKKSWSFETKMKELKKLRIEAKKAQEVAEKLSLKADQYEHNLNKAKQDLINILTEKNSSIVLHGKQIDVSFTKNSFVKKSYLWPDTPLITKISVKT